MEDKLTANITDSVERILRYLIPGVIFCILFALSYPTDYFGAFQKISDSNIFVFLVILAIGMSLYTIESQIIRFTLEPLAYLLNLSPVNVFSDHRLCNYSEAHAELILARKKSSDYPKDYYVYLWSLIHYSFIMSALILFFAYFHEIGSWMACHAYFLGIGGAVLLLFSICSYGYMQVLEKNTTLRMNSTKIAEKQAQ